MRKIIWIICALVFCLNLSVNASEALISKNSLSDMLLESQNSNSPLISGNVFAAKKSNSDSNSKTANRDSNSKSDPRKLSKISELFTRKNPALSKSEANEYAKYVLEAASKFSQDAFVIAAIIVHESTVNRKAVSKGGDYGLMQVRWKVHAGDIKKRFPEIKSASGMFNARTNIMYGTEIFAQCMSKTGTLEKALMRYSSGSTKLTTKVLQTLRDLKAN